MLHIQMLLSIHDQLRVLSKSVHMPFTPCASQEASTMLRKAAHEQRQIILLLELLETFTTKAHSLRPPRTGSKQSEMPDSPARMAATHLIIFLTPDLDDKLRVASRRV